MVHNTFYKGRCSSLFTDQVLSFTTWYHFAQRPFMFSAIFNRMIYAINVPGLTPVIVTTQFQDRINHHHQLSCGLRSISTFVTGMMKFWRGSYASQCHHGKKTCIQPPARNFAAYAAACVNRACGVIKSYNSCPYSC